MALAVAACSDDSTGITVEDLVGTWEATEIVFTSTADPSESVDAVDFGVSLTVTITSDGTVTSVFDDGQGGTDTDSGTLSVDGSTLTIGSDSFEAERSGDVLTLTGAVEFDFDEDGSDDPATVVVRLERQ
jgi:hypothetical protein